MNAQTNEMLSSLKYFETKLNESLSDLDDKNIDAEVGEMLFQCYIFIYDVGYEFGAMLLLSPQGLAKKIVLKNMMLKMYEFNSLWHEEVQRKLMSIASRKNIDGMKEGIRLIKQEYKDIRSQVAAWKDVRNGLGGHYETSADTQRKLFDSIDEAQVCTIHEGFINYCVRIMNILVEGPAKTKNSTDIR